MLPNRMTEYATKIEELTAENKRLMEKLSSKTAECNISRNGMKWTECELEQLIAETADCKSIQDIANIHMRSISSIRYKYLFYGLKLYEKNIPIESILKVIPLKKKELLEYINKINENKKELTDCGRTEKPNTIYIPYEKRGILLFDLNGTLCHRTKGPSKECFIRPCVRELSKLKNFYRLGIFTSMMRSNAFDVIRLVEDKCGRIFDRGLIFTREHTFEFTTYEQQTFNIPDYKTKKSLAHVLPELFNGDTAPNIKIIDDEIVKIAEKEYSIIVPTWDGYSQDTYMKDLVTDLTLPMTSY